MASFVLLLSPCFESRCSRLNVISSINLSSVVVLYFESNSNLVKVKRQPLEVLSVHVIAQEMVISLILLLLLISATVFVVVVVVVVDSKQVDSVNSEEVISLNDGNRLK